MGKRKKVEKTPEQINLENVQRLMEEVRMTCMGFADCGGQLQGIVDREQLVQTAQEV
jgi:uncharacterized protein YdeI (YjbR/CyaY-like superfamily)